MTTHDLVKACPFCGLATELPHETQEACIEALQAEIGRVRAVLEHVRVGSSASAPEGGSERA